VKTAELDAARADVVVAAKAWLQEQEDWTGNILATERSLEKTTRHLEKLEDAAIRALPKRGERE